LSANITLATPGVAVAVMVNSPLPEAGVTETLAAPLATELVKGPL
jgi:hypothetical protein